MIILRKEYASEAGASGMMKLKNPLKKFNGEQSQIRKIIVNDQEITDPKIMLNQIRNFSRISF